MVLKLLLCHEGSEYVLSFEKDKGKVDSIAHEQTDTQNHPVPHSNIDLAIGYFRSSYILKFIHL